MNHVEQKPASSPISVTALKHALLTFHILQPRSRFQVDRQKINLQLF